MASTTAGWVHDIEIQTDVARGSPLSTTGGHVWDAVRKCARHPLFFCSRVGVQLIFCRSFRADLLPCLFFPFLPSLMIVNKARELIRFLEIESERLGMYVCQDRRAGFMLPHPRCHCHDNPCCLLQRLGSRLFAFPLALVDNWWLTPPSSPLARHCCAAVF